MALGFANRAKLTRQLCEALIPVLEGKTPSSPAPVAVFYRGPFPLVAMSIADAVRSVNYNITSTPTVSGFVDWRLANYIDFCYLDGVDATFVQLPDPVGV